MRIVFTKQGRTDRAENPLPLRRPFTIERDRQPDDRRLRTRTVHAAAAAAVQSFLPRRSVADSSVQVQMEHKISVGRICRCLGGGWFCLRRLERGHATDGHRKDRASYRWTDKLEAVSGGDMDRLDHLLNLIKWLLMNTVIVVGVSCFDPRRP